jgi:hypothetical protein
VRYRGGNRYLRALFVQAAWVVLIRIKDWDRYGLKAWIDAHKKRLHFDSQYGYADTIVSGRSKYEPEINVG